MYLEAVISKRNEGPDNTVDEGFVPFMFVATDSTAKKRAEEGSPQLDAQDAPFLVPEATGF